MCYYRLLCFTFIATILGSMNIVSSQGNCLLYPDDSGERIACELSYRAIEYKQGSKESQILFDAAIKIGPKYAWAYYEKSVPFFKRGLLAEGIGLINKAVELEPQNYLYYRAYWYFYNRSYEYCIRDLEELYSKYKTSYSSTPGGEMEMRLLLAMAHALTGNVSKGISWIQNLMEVYEQKPHLKGNFDHFVLGVLYYTNNHLELAQAEFEKQIQVDENLADTYYYLGLIKEKTSESELAQEYFTKALSKVNREDGGYSANLFVEFNTFQRDVEEKLNVGNYD